MFSGHNAFRFAKDPYYSNGFIPTVKQLVKRMMTGLSRYGLTPPPARPDPGFPHLPVTFARDAFRRVVDGKRLLDGGSFRLVG